MSTEQWGVLVNETGIFATRGGADWWVPFWANHSTSSNWTELGASAMGGTWHIGFPSRGDADFAWEYMISQGIHASHLKVVTLADARKSVDHKQNRRPARTA